MRLLKLRLRVCLVFATGILFITDIFALRTSKETDTVNIGLLVSDNRSVSAIRGAEIAIRQENLKEGPEGRYFKLVVRSMEGVWGTGSVETVNLLYKQKVWAILGSHDGRNAHLVEQVTAKEHNIFLSAWASDPTLSQAFVPWYFSCVPNDRQQSAALIEEIYNIRKLEKIAALADNSYDSKLALSTFVREINLAGKPSPVQFFYNNSDENFNYLVDKLNNADIKCVILFGAPSASIKIIQTIHQKKMNPLIFGTLSLLGEEVPPEQEMSAYENVILVTSGQWLKPEASEFRREYQNAYGTLPGAVAAYAYDGIKVIINAIKNAGFNREMLQKSMTKTQYKGITGLIRFDDKGNRSGIPPLIQIKNGNPITIDR
jgi:branched-chain amino acid transport system substrate-binding protein